ncbi:MAG TPA: pyridoxamine 5'-phosphate oxidase family protein [Nocardioidaceae bacterium]|nr:pyridoxamine 5'-phosphate oxidase family protein [Nocardioidaceae bacterium]
MKHDELADYAQGLIDKNNYMTLGTVDSNGRPWTSPVYFAAAGLREYYWTSTTNAEHSRNLAERPQVSLVIFDSTVPPYHGQAVYVTGEAEALSGPDLERALEVYPGPADNGAASLTVADVTGSSPYRLYRVTASDVWVLCQREPRQPCELHGIAYDHRARVPLPSE